MIEPVHERPINVGTRLGSMLLDHAIMTMIAMVFYMPVFIVVFTRAFENAADEPPDINFFNDPLIYLAMFGYALYFCKDCIQGRSPAKRILKLQVVDNKTGLPASPLQCLVRNLFCIFWMIEGVVAMVNPARRIGDRVAGTRVVHYDATVEQPKLNVVQLVLAVVISYGLMILILWSISPKNF